MKAAAAVLLTYAIIAVLAIIGWVMNIVAIFGLDFSHVSAEMVIRIIGIFVAPIGAVYGWF